MNISADTLIAGRYQLVDRLGTGAMGEVWRARDTRFESRLVAVKLLREDETLKEDALNRDRMVVRLEQQASRGGITAPFALEAIASALAVSNIEGLKARAASAFAAAEGIPSSAVTALFDEVANDPALNDNARIRAKMRRLFRDEANTVANLRHDNVVSIFDYGDHEGIPFLVMDYIEGRTLYQMLQAQETIGQSRGLQFIEDLCAGLGYAHRHKLVHRDIKPANLIIASTTGSLKILDFGVVRRLGSASTIGVPVGTFCYMSPEQTRGDAALDHRSDIFAVGLVFYELMSGRKAFPPSKSITDLVARIQRDPPPPLSELVPSISPAIEDIIGRAIEKRPEDRYQDLAIMGREIARIRAPLEAAEQSERTMIRAKPAVMPGNPPALKVKPPEVSVTELLASAERAFASGDDQAAVDFCSRILTQRAGFPPALSLLARAEARRWDSRLREVLQQAEKEMALDDLNSAKATLGRAREIDPSSPRIRAVEEKLEAALAARAAALERAERARIEQLKPAPATPPPTPSAVDLDADAVTRPLLRAPLGRPPLGSMSKPPSASPPPAPPMPPPAPGMPSAAPPSGAIKTASSVRRRRIVKPDSQDTSFAVAGPIVPPELLGAVPPPPVSPVPPAAPPRPASGVRPAATPPSPVSAVPPAAPPRPASGVRPPVATPPPRVNVVPPAASRRPASGVRPGSTPPRADPAGETMLVRSSGARPPLQQPAVPGIRSAGPAANIPRADSPLVHDSPTRRVDSRSVQRAIAKVAQPVQSAVRQPKPRAWTLIWFAAVAVAVLAIVLYVASLRRPKAMADPTATQVAATPTPPALVPPALTPPAPSPDAPAAAPGPAGGSDERAVSGVVDAYLAALSARDVGEVAKVRDLNASIREGLRRQFQAVRSQRVAIAGTPRITIDGARARVEATLRYDVERSSGERDQTDVPATLHLNRIRNEWRIVRVAPPQ